MRTTEIALKLSTITDSWAYGSLPYEQENLLEELSRVWLPIRFQQSMLLMWIFSIAWSFEKHFGKNVLSQKPVEAPDRL